MHTLRAFDYLEHFCHHGIISSRVRFLSSHHFLQIIIVVICEVPLSFAFLTMCGYLHCVRTMIDTYQRAVRSKDLFRFTGFVLNQALKQLRVWTTPQWATEKLYKPLTSQNERKEISPRDETSFSNREVMGRKENVKKGILFDFTLNSQSYS